MTSVLLYGGRSVYSTSAYGTATARSGITVASTGSVAGTNAPYLQLRVCQKS